MVKKYLPFCICISIYLLGISFSPFAQQISITNDTGTKKISFGNATIKGVLDYNKQANISFLSVDGNPVIHGDAGIYTEIRSSKKAYSTLYCFKDPVIKIKGNTISINDINYGDEAVSITESWIITISNTNIKLNIRRRLPEEINAEETSSPVFLFNNINTWEGAFQDYGGLAWFYLFNKKEDTYGVHSNAASFWNSTTCNGLDIAVDAPGKEVAMSYSRTAKDELAFKILASSNEIIPRMDSGTNRRRFLRDTITAVWDPQKLNSGGSAITISFAAFNFDVKYGRGKFAGINGQQVSAVLNTIARIGVIDKDLFGGNSWHTPYGPICLHEQYIAQMGLAINDKNYLNGYRKCLDFYFDNAIKKDGRVWPRWAYTNEDAMPGAFTNKGFYEAQWGYLLDSNPDLVTNVAELYDQSGDLAWVKTHQQDCEKILDWILKRDFNNNGLVEMMTDSMQQKRGSDWIDIIWASYENAFVNAKLFHALELWASIEKQLGNTSKANYYHSFAEKLKTSFNKPTTQGGFWDEEKKCYVHWREKDGSIHGRNMVTPVNFMAIGYGICDDAQRTKIILDNIETQMQKEHLFIWPLCMFTYENGEGNDWQFPFPNYENGDIFLSWGALGVKAYASYKPEIAVKYVKNVLAQYAKDGLAFQRYGRAAQDGRGDDILSGNSLTIVGLYQAIYGINPLHNRFYLDPHITSELAGTELKYNFRDQELAISLDMNKYKVANNQFAITDSKNFGFFSTANELLYFNADQENAALQVSTKINGNLSLDIKMWNQDQRSWTQSSTDVSAQKLVYQVNDLAPNIFYTISINHILIERLKSDNKGSLIFTYKSVKIPAEIELIKK